MHEKSCEEITFELSSVSLSSRLNLSFMRPDISSDLLSRSIYKRMFDNPSIN